MKKFVSLLKLTNIVNDILSTETLMREASSLCYPTNSMEHLPPFEFMSENETVTLSMRKTDFASGQWSRTVGESIGGVAFDIGNTFNFPYVMEYELFDTHYPWLTETEKDILKQITYLSTVLAYRLIYHVVYASGLDDVEAILGLPVVEEVEVDPISVLTALGLITEQEDDGTNNRAIEDILRCAYRESPYTPTQRLTTKTWSNINNNTIWIAAGCSMYDILAHMENCIAGNYNGAYTILRKITSVPLIMSYFIVEQYDSYYKALSQIQYRNFKVLCGNIFNDVDYFDYDRENFVVRESYYGWVAPSYRYAVHVQGEGDYFFFGSLLSHILDEMKKKAESNISNLSINSINADTKGNINLVLNARELSWDPVSEAS